MQFSITVTHKASKIEISCAYLSHVDTPKRIIVHKAILIKNSRKYSEYLAKLFKELKIIDLKEAAILGAVDAMIYDIACSLDFTKQKGNVNAVSYTHLTLPTILRV